MHLRTEQIGRLRHYSFVRGLENDDEGNACERELSHRDAALDDSDRDALRPGTRHETGHDGLHITTVGLSNFGPVVLELCLHLGAPIPRKIADVTDG